MWVPEHYKDFACLAGACRDSCCIGWELDIDDETYGRYLSETGPFGDRLRAHMEDIEEDGEVFHTFRRDGRRCPFLNPKNLCDICLTLGEDALCTVCTEYPRYTIRFGDELERTLTLSCEEAGRLMFETEGPLRMVEIGGAGDADDPDDGRDDRDDRSDSDDVRDDYDDGWDDEADEVISSRDLREIRRKAIQILQDRSRSIEERLARYQTYSCSVQERFNGSSSESGTSEGSDKETDRSDIFWETDPEAFEERLAILDELEILDHEWQSVFDQLSGWLDEGSYPEKAEAFRQDAAAAAERERSYEHLMVYFTLRYFPQAADDGDILGKARFCLFCLKVIRDMDALRFDEMTAGDWSLSDRIDNVRIFCKEVEHSDDNIAVIMEELLFLTK